MNEQQSQTLLLKVDLCCTIGNNELIAQGEELETSAKFRVFSLSNILSPRLSMRDTGVRFSYYVAFRTAKHILFLYCTLGELLVCFVTS